MRFRLTLSALLICFLFATATSQSVIGASLSTRFERLGPFGGDVRSLLTDSSEPSAVYLGTSNGEIYKSADSGKSWRMLMPGIEQPSYVVDTLVQHPRNSRHIYAGAWDSYSEGGGLFESRDAGATWARIKLPSELTDVRGIALCRDNPSYMLVATTGGVFLSKDGGGEWNGVGEGLLTKAHSVAIDPVDPNILYVGTWRLGYVSRDMGKSWTIVENKGMPLDSDIFSMTIQPGNPSVVFAGACSGVYRSDDGVRTWTRLRVLPDKFTIRTHVVYLDPANSKKVYAGTTEGLYVSENEGRSWALLTSKSITVNAVQVDPLNSRRILLGTEYHGVQRSEDGGKTWQPSNDGFTHKQIPWIQFDQDEKGRFIAGLHSGGGGWYGRKTAGGDWTLEQIEPGMRVLSFLFLPNGSGRLAGTPQGIYHKKNASAPWKKLTGAIARRTVYSLATDQGGKIVYAGTDQGIYRAPIDTLEFRIPPGNRLVPMAWRIIAPEGTPETVLAATNLGILRSQDRGVTWKVTSAHGLPERVMINAMVVSPADKDRFFLGTSAGLFESESGGVYWKQSGGRDMKTGIADILFLGGDENRILAANQTTGGLFLSEDGGAEWKKIFNPEFASPVFCLTQDPDNPSIVYIGTRYEGVYRLTLE
ncbi:MAG: hypothetical protein LBJ21_04680 [Acidobacteriota bacterium]|jgi:photosystem II stability/assembly factor-like uncharacterized protein|nr:hypothetical protein [Acidobacteriota bacterium]